MGFFSIISGALSAIGGSIASAVGSIGAAVSSFAANVAPTIGCVLEKASGIFGVISNWANKISQILSIFKPNENVDDVGDRALQAAAAGINPEKFANHAEYMEALRKFDLNPEVSKKTSAAVKVTAGMAVASLGIEEKFNLIKGGANGIWLLPMVNSDYFTPERVKAMLENGRAIGDVLAYLENRMSGEEARDFRVNYEMSPTGEPMSNAEKSDLYKALDQSREKWAELEEKIKDSN